jgi:hypothetical protein
MDLRAEAQRLRIDVVSVQASSALTAGGVPHVLLKGPSTSLWLYDPPRAYSDVDLLVPYSRLADAEAALSGVGIERALAPTGSVRSHSVLFHGADSVEVDVHVTLPKLVPDGDLPWRVLGPHVERLDLEVGVVPVLDRAARCLVLALHGLDIGEPSEQALEDLRRARSSASDAEWAIAEALARELKAHELFRVSLARADGLPDPDVSWSVYLQLHGEPELGSGLRRLTVDGWRGFPRRLWAELFPHPDLIRQSDAPNARGALGLVAGYLRRWLRISRELGRLALRRSR